jgi:alkylhydroperoxidase family enzyme
VSDRAAVAGDGGRGAAARALEQAVLGSHGRAYPAQRQAARDYGERVAADPEQAEPSPELYEVAALVDKVARHAYRVTDDDVERLKAAGHAEDELFDLIVATALGAGLGRRALGNAAVDRYEATR